MTRPVSRREFLRNAGVTTALSVGFPLWARAESAGSLYGKTPMLVVIFLRGAADGLHLVPPIGDPCVGCSSTAVGANENNGLAGFALRRFGGLCADSVPTVCQLRIMPRPTVLLCRVAIGWCGGEPKEKR